MPDKPDVNYLNDGSRFTACAYLNYSYSKVVLRIGDMFYCSLHLQTFLPSPVTALWATEFTQKYYKYRWTLKLKRRWIFGRSWYQSNECRSLFRGQDKVKSLLFGVRGALLPLISEHIPEVWQSVLNFLFFIGKANVIKCFFSSQNISVVGKIQTDVGVHLKHCKALDYVKLRTIPWREGKVAVSSWSLQCIVL